MGNWYASTTTNAINNSGSLSHSTATIDTKSFYIENKSVYDIINEHILKTAEPEVPIETKTKLKADNGKLYSRYFKNGHFTYEKFIMSDIKDVKYYNNTVIVVFADNTQTKAVLDPEDYYSLEQGISICITKKLLGDEGSAIYNKLIGRAMKVIDNNAKAAEKAEKKKLKEMAKREAVEAKHQKKKLKKREEAIEIQKEAYIRAMRELNGNN